LAYFGSRKTLTFFLIGLQPEARLHHLKRRFSRDPDLEARYRAVTEEYVNKGYTMKLTTEEATERYGIT